MTDSKTDPRQMESQLWSMANSLRGNMSANEFQNYILGFMFYRYLSLHQEAYIKDQKLLEPEDGQDLNAAYLEVPDDELDDYLQDIAGYLGYAIRPQYTWKTIMQKINNHAIAASDFQSMFDDFEKNAQINTRSSQDFRNIFSDVNLFEARLGNTAAARARALSGIAQVIDNLEMDDEHGRDVLGNVYEYLIAEFAASAGKKAGEFYTPHEVSRVLARLATADAPADGQFSVYDPAMGSGSLLLTVQDELPNGDKPGRVQFYGQELNTTTYNLARMNLMMHRVDYQNMDLRNGDTLEGDWPDGEVDGIDRPRHFDAVVANPPYSQSWDNNDSKMKDPRFKDYGRLAPATKADYAFVLHGLYHLNDHGTMAIVLPHGVLFRGAAEGVIRENLLKNNQLDAVIGMPEKLFYSTSIPTAILVFKKNRTNKDVLFIDASNDFEKGKKQNSLRAEDIDKIIETYKARKDVNKYAHVATMDEIKDNDYNLNIPRYVDTFEEPEPIDIEATEKEIADIDDQIAKLTDEYNKMKAQLVKTDDKD
ncbi:type I restriction-modification system subunit M [Lacticaseibacillus hegangensis]|uniref:site-specific DNA-methyltransferase (adenine-specific) n=1 Tax=Lacticaseibacillus hegangensis TaxID=2486010 RepID=A0ABW4D0P3_9LACO|nr:type I restriction-modification system subunit M [Lacticaseibacillus hegangensis]